MFVILVKYLKPLPEIDRLVGEHREFLRRYYDSGHLLLSGAREPRTGGIIIARAETKAELENIISQDPFKREKVAEYEIIEFRPSMTAERLADLKA